MDDCEIPHFDPDEQQHYTDLRLRRAPQYTGPCADLSDAHVKAFLAELLECVGLPHDLPVPPSGLPGHFNNPDPEVMGIIRDGVRYLYALNQGEKKTLWNIHDRIAQLLRQKYYDGRDEHRGGRVEVYIGPSIQLAALTPTDESAVFVYFIQSGAGPIKIGKARNVESRLKSLQTAHPAKLVLLAQCLGGGPVESEYHRRFAAHRQHGEWFDPHPDIMAEVERLAATQPCAVPALLANGGG